MGILLFIDPQVVLNILTTGSSSVGFNSATLEGNVLSGSFEERGFQINTTPHPTDLPRGKIKETGSFGMGTYSLVANNLRSGKTYYFRAYGRSGTTIVYGAWLAFVTLPAIYNVTINGIDRTTDIVLPSLKIDDAINDEQNTCGFIFDNRSGLGFPSEDQEIVITNNNGQKMFAGYIVGVSLAKSGVVMGSIQCVDYARLFDSNLVHKTYLGMTDKAIIQDIVDVYCPGFGITTNNVIEGVIINQISFNYLQPSQCLRRISELTGRNWYIDYDKDIHYFPLLTEEAPLHIDADSGHYFDLTIKKDSSQIKNRVYVRGGTKLSEFTTYVESGDNEKRTFVLPDKPSEVSIEIDRGSGFVAETVGIKHINTSGFDWYLNYQEKYIDQDDSGITLTPTDILKLTYKYEVPILVAVENTDSIQEHGQKEFAIFDTNLKTTESARERAAAELTDYAERLIEGSFRTYEAGYFSGQYINISLASTYGVDDNYVVQKVTATSLGAGKYVYDVRIASAKTMGIIRFLIELLEDNRNLIKLDDAEVIDELFEIDDSLLADSILDELTIDSQGPYFTWAIDSLDTAVGRLRWDLGQWG